MIPSKMHIVNQSVIISTMPAHLRKKLYSQRMGDHVQKQKWQKRKDKKNTDN